MISKPSINDESQLKSLWKNVFGDSDSFIDLFFRNRYDRNCALIFKHQGRIAGMLYYPVYDFVLRGIRGTIGYVCGAATLPACRGRGIMGNLLETAFGEMYGMGCRFSALIPASDSLYEYYRRYGYREFFYRKRLTFKRGNLGPVKIAAPGKNFRLRQVSDSDHVYEIYLQAIAHLETAVIHSNNTYRSAFAEFILSGGTVLADNDAGVYAMIRTAGTTLQVREAFSAGGDMTGFHTLLASELFELYPAAETIVMEVPVKYGQAADTGFRTGMIKTLVPGAESPEDDGQGYMKFMLEE